MIEQLLVGALELLIRTATLIDARFARGLSRRRFALGFGVGPAFGIPGRTGFLWPGLFTGLRRIGRAGSRWRFRSIARLGSRFAWTGRLFRRFTSLARPGFIALAVRSTIPGTRFLLLAGSTGVPSAGWPSVPRPLIPSSSVVLCVGGLLRRRAGWQSSARSSRGPVAAASSVASRSLGSASMVRPFRRALERFGVRTLDLVRMRSAVGSPSVRSMAWCLFASSGDSPCSDSGTGVGSLWAWSAGLSVRFVAVISTHLIEDAFEGVAVATAVTGERFFRRGTIVLRRLGRVLAAPVTVTRLLFRVVLRAGPLGIS